MAEAEAEAEDDDCDDDESGGDFVIAVSARASRAARSPPPSAEALKYEADTIRAAECKLHATGHAMVGRVLDTVWARSAAGRRRELAKAATSSGAASRSTNKLSHVFSLQRAIDTGSKEASFLVEDAGIPLEASQLAAAGMRSCSVRSSVTHKIRKTCAGGMQTSRLSTGMLGSAWATQACSVAIALGCAEYIAEREGCALSNPAATHALNPATLVALDRESGSATDSGATFILPKTTRLLPQAMPTRLGTHSVLATMETFARNEMDYGKLRQWVPYNSTALGTVCRHVTDTRSGVNVWAAWVLLAHMLHDPRMRDMMRDSPISDLEVETALLFGAYARAEITRRARIDTANAAKKRKGEAPSLREPALSDTMSVTASETSEGVTPEVHVPPEQDTEAWDNSTRATLSLKRKRVASSGVVQNSGLLSYWAAALDSKYASLLKMLVTQSRAQAASAAVDTLHKQAPEGIAATRNALLVDISGTNAIKSAAAISSLIVTTPDRVPRVLAWRSRSWRASKGKSNTEMHVGIARSLNDAAHTALHACKLAPTHLQPAGGNFLRCVWSLGSKELTPIDNCDALVTGATDTHQHLRAIEAGHVEFKSRFTHDKVVQQLTHRLERTFKKGAVDLTLSGIARGTIVVRATIVVSDSQCASGEAAARVVRDVAREETDQTNAMSAFASHTPLADRPLTETAEPYCSPSTPLALGIQTNELMRTALRSRNHRGDPCRHACTSLTEEELAEAGADEQDLPGPTLPLVDAKVALLDDPRDKTNPRLARRPDAQLCRAALTLTVCGDTPVRLHELLDAACRDGSVAATLQVNALALAGAARASETNEIATSLGASHVNSSIASAKRILVSDLNLRLYCTINDVYRVGHSRVAKRFQGTVWAGCYGAAFDLGTSGSMGIRCSSITADKRNHGKLLMGQSQVDDWCRTMAHTRVVKVGKDEYAHVPTACRGVPHCTVPGIHSYLHHYVEGMERARTLLGVESARSVDSLQCMPFSPFSEKLAPYLSENCNPTASRCFRNPFDRAEAGRAFSVDHTCDELSIFRPPLVALTAVTCPEDNVFAQAKYSLSSAFGAAAVIARCARTVAKRQHALSSAPGATDGPNAPVDAKRAVGLLKDLLDALFEGGTPPPGTDFYTASVAAVMLNCIFPASHALCGLVIHRGLEDAPSAVAHSLSDACPMGKSLPQLLAPEPLRQARAFWRPFARATPETNAWTAVEPLLLQLIALDGRHDLSRADYDAVWNANERLIQQGAWLVASPDGVAPPPDDSRLAGVRHWRHVISDVVNPRIVEDECGRLPRATLIGIMPAGFQQVLALLIASAALPAGEVTVQLAHNYGQLIFRPSAAADILTSTGTPRSDKSVSVLGVDGDEAAFGTRRAKIESCKLQRAAWRHNLNYVKPLCAAISPPLPEHVLARGFIGEVNYIAERRRELHGHKMKTVQEEAVHAAFESALE